MFVVKKVGEQVRSAAAVQLDTLITCGVLRKFVSEVIDSDPSCVFLDEDGGYDGRTD